MNIVKPNPAIVSDVISSIISAVGKVIILRQEGVRTLCPICEGHDPFCITCSGSIYIYDVQDVTVTAAVKWKSLEKKRYRPEGQYVDGDCTVTIAYTEELEALMYNVQEVIVDNRRCTIDRWNLQGSPMNRIYLVLKEDESLIGKRVS